MANASGKPTPQDGVAELIKEKKTEKIMKETSMEDVIRICNERANILEKIVNNPRNNPFMLLNTEKMLLPVFSVYTHADEDGVIMYVGKASDGRSHDVLLRRALGEHTTWMFKQVLAKRKYIEMVKVGLTHDEALNYESDLIAKYDPKFNK